jgi:Phosphodiester glycosidase
MRRGGESRYILASGNVLYPERNDFVRMRNPVRRNLSRARNRPKQKWWWIIVAGVLVLCLITASLAILPAVNPSFGAETADVLRAIVGPQPVALLESVSFKLQDQLNQLRSAMDGGKALITFSQSSTQVPSSSPNVSPTSASPIATVRPTSTPRPIPQVTSTPINNAVTDAPQIGWQAYGPSVNGAPAMARTLILLDPRRSYTGVALVRMDLSKLQLHMMPGKIEPSHPSGITKAIPSLGMIPANDQSTLAAAFNGGFKGIHGRYGMMVNGFTLLPPLPGLATVAIYRDGHVEIGVWGKEINRSDDMMAFRQNCPPLIENGQVNSALSLNNRTAWGYTGNTDITWRTGIGITQDGRYLIYAVGNGTSAESLADAFLQAGAYQAMQLDINQFYAHFYTYQPGNPETSGGFDLTGQRLLDQMINNPHLYLTPNVRDFFYLTAR